MSRQWHDRPGTWVGRWRAQDEPECALCSGWGECVAYGGVAYGGVACGGVAWIGILDDGDAPWRYRRKLRFLDAGELMDESSGYSGVGMSVVVGLEDHECHI
jgi:hypothetical protein